MSRNVIQLKDKDNNVYDVKDANARQDISELKSAINRYNSNNLVDMYGNRNTQTNKGVTITWSNYKTFSFNSNSQQASGNPNLNIINSQSELPQYMESGKTIYIKYTSNDSDVILQLVPYVNGTAGSAIDIGIYAEYIIPSNITGIIIRLRGKNSSKVYSASGTVELLTAETNANLLDMLQKRIYSKRVDRYISNNTVTLGDIIEDGFYIVGNDLIVTDAPSGFTPTALVVEGFSTNRDGRFVKQTVFSILNPSNTSYMRISNSSGVFGSWIDITPQTVPITPEIYITPTGDTTDRKTDIEAALNSNGVCKLAEGTYYVSGITMPAESEIIGLGNNTVIRLLDSVTSGSAITCGIKCKIKDVRIIGSDSRQGGGDSIGTRNGVYVSFASTENDLLVEISGCSFIGFSGAGVKVLTTGYYMLHSVCISDCFFRFNKVGVYLAEKAEFSVIANCVFGRNYFGMLDNGGNNKIVNCGFDGNSKGFVIDGTGITNSNNGHGSVVGCSFNHNSIYGIYIKACGSAMMFDSCNIFLNTDSSDTDHSIAIVDSTGVTFANCILSGVTATSENSTGSQMNGCRFSANPTIGTGITVHNCSLFNGTPIT